ncbi:MAG TPA: rRNA maturation RNase YbeY [Lachnospiraceae bacterium]|nr:rRNA maturation RNase YbeY [Lachnospiraceae bacterium]
MSFYADNEYEKEFPFDIDKTIENVINACVRMVSCPYEVSVNILITDDENIRRYNKEYRDIDKETDVLSFPAVDYEKPADLSIAEKNRYSYFDADTDELILGDIILNGDRVFKQAKEYDHSVLREFSFLIAHSMLHLFGYDHMEKEDETEMFLLQDKIMDELNILRG